MKREEKAKKGRYDDLIVKGHFAKIEDDFQIEGPFCGASGLQGILARILTLFLRRGSSWTVMTSNYYGMSDKNILNKKQLQ